MGWQWSAGSGPDAAPYFRVFNPVTQREKFDPDARLRQIVGLPRGASSPMTMRLAFFEACPRHWGLDPQDSYPMPIVSLDGGRKRALTAYEARRL